MLSARIALDDRESGFRVAPLSVAVDNTSPLGLTVTYVMKTPGTYRMGVSVQDQYVKANQTRDDLHTYTLGSPFIVAISPGRAAANNTRCRGASLHQAAKNVPHTFAIQLHDSFTNPLTVGGGRFFIRLLGGNIPLVRSTFPNATVAPGDVVAPLCADRRNGQYVCTYTPHTAGTHRLHVGLLEGSESYPGGDGLVGSYFDSYDPGAPDVPPVAIRLDPSVCFSWAAGSIIPAVVSPASQGGGGQGTPAATSDVSGASGGGVVSSLVARTGDTGAIAVQPLHDNGQVVRWEGYLLAPRTDTYRLSTRSLNIHSTIFLDGTMVYDSATGTHTPKALVADAAYRLVVEARVDPRTYPAPVEISLLWSADAIKQSVVPQFFLYSRATEVALSPFVVDVV